MTDKVTAIITGQDSGVALMPRLATLAEAVCGQPWSELSMDPGQIVMAAKRLAALFGSDTLVVGDDPLLFDDTGIQHPKRVAALVEAVRRLGAESGGLPVVVILTGPAGLAGSEGDDGSNDTLKEAMSSTVEALCEGRPALILLDESATDEVVLTGMKSRRLYNTLRNVAAYFDVPLGAILPQGDTAGLVDRLKLSVAFADGCVVDAAAVSAMREAGASAGIFLPVERLDAVAAGLSKLGDGGLLITSPLSATTIDMMHAFMRAARGAIH